MAWPRRAPYTPSRCEGVGRHESPQRRENIGGEHRPPSTLKPLPEL